MSERPLLFGLAAMIASAVRDGVPERVRESVHLRVLDTLGICMAATDLDTSRAMKKFVTMQGGIDEASGIGAGQRMPAPSAALLNGTLAHSLDFDDTHLPSVVHPSASIIPACLALGEARGATGKEVVGAIGAGIETCVRLGMAGYDHEHRNSAYFDRGQHATAMCGVISAAGSCAALLGLDMTGIADAMGIAVSMAGGVIEANRSGGTVKRIHCGWAAHGGVVAAQLAQLGISAPPTALEGRFGFFRAFLDGRFESSAVTEGLGEQWSVDKVHFKPYPANHFTHAGIDAAIELREAGLVPEEIESLTLGVSRPVIHTIGEPIEVKRQPETGYQAQFSGPYTVVAALLGGHGLGLGLEDFTDELSRDPERRALMGLVDVVEDEACSDLFPDQFGAVLTAVTHSGRSLVARVMTNRGGDRRPLSRAEVGQKFSSNAGRVMASSTIREVEQQADGLGEAGDVRGLMGLLRELRD